MTTTLDNSKIGDGLTLCIHTDCHAHTILRRTPKTITAQRDKATLLNKVGSGEPDAMTFEPGGFVGHWSGGQRWSYEPDPNGEIIKVTRRYIQERMTGNGDEATAGHYIWKLAGHRARSPGLTASPGRHEYYDHNF